MNNKVNDLQKKQEKQVKQVKLNSNGKPTSKLLAIIAMSVVFLLILSCCMGALFLWRTNRETTEKGSENEQTASLEIQTANVSEKTNLTQRDFINKAAPTYEGTSKEVVRIVEVIPHESCSIFPYLIDWKTEEEYNKNTPLGYEGITIGLFTNSIYSYVGDQSAFSLIKGGNKRQTLTDYGVTLINYNSRYDTSQIGWWRESDTSASVVANGYFEYVGYGKGLYAINTNKIIEKQDTTDNGIRYQMEALERTASETQKGKWAVNNPFYYWGIDYQNESYPTSNPAIKSRTEFNYDLQFAADESAQNATDTQYKIKKVEGITNGVGVYNKYEYEAYLAENATYDDYKGGMIFTKGGNYSLTAAGVIKVSLASLTEIEKKQVYVRISDKKTNDGLKKDSTGATMDLGYFEKYDPTTHGTNMTYVYQLSFTHTQPSKGIYKLSEDNVLSTINAGNNETFSKILFEYAGDGKGTYDLTFIYAPSTDNYIGTKYDSKLLKVTNGEGRYSLTSSETKANLYISQTGDYGKVVQNIDCNGVDYDANTNGKCYSGGGIPAGLSMGMDLYNIDIEYGGWVFHEITDTTQMQKTQIEDIRSPQVGDVIYVTYQKRYVRYYCRNKWVNNEWFKLLIYMNDPDDEDKPFSESKYYDSSLSGQTNVKNAKKYLDEFDSNYRIEIIQRTPSQLTVDEVKNADLLYISEREGLNGAMSKWSEISSLLERETGDTLPALPSNADTGSGYLSFSDEFSPEVLMTIYDQCLYKQNVGLMLNNDIRNKGAHMQNLETRDTLGKLYYFATIFMEPKDFAQFIATDPDGNAYAERNDDYTQILADASLLAYRENRESYGDSSGGYYNFGKTYDLGSGEVENIEERVDNWSWKYFSVFSRNYHPDWSSWPYGDYVLQNGVNGDFTGDKHVGQVLEGQSLYLTYDYVANKFQNTSDQKKIWLILHNRNKSKGKLVVEILNGEVTQGEDSVRVIYADAYNKDSFQIDYQINTFPESATGAALVDAVLTMEDGSYTANNPGPAYKTEYSFNVRNAFLKSGTTELQDGVVMKKATITATDVNGKTASADVWIVLREAFNLN